MARRYTGNMNGEQYLGNTNTTEVHDLDNEQTGSNECQIDEIIKAKHDKPFKTRKAAEEAGYDLAESPMQYWRGFWRLRLSVVTRCLGRPKEGRSRVF